MRKEEILSKTIIAMSIIVVIGILIIGHTGTLQAQAPLKPQPDPWDLYYGNAVDLFYPLLSINWILKPDPTPWISLNPILDTNPELWDLYFANEMALF